MQIYARYEKSSQTPRQMRSSSQAKKSSRNFERKNKTEPLAQCWMHCPALQTHHCQKSHVTQSCVNIRVYVSLYNYLEVYIYNIRNYTQLFIHTYIYYIYMLIYSYTLIVVYAGDVVYDLGNSNVGGAQKHGTIWQIRQKYCTLQKSTACFIEVLDVAQKYGTLQRSMACFKEVWHVSKKWSTLRRITVLNVSQAP